MENKFNEGDKVFYEFEPHTVEDVVNGEVHRVKDDMFTRSGRYLTEDCFKPTADIIKISARFQGLNDSIRHTAGPIMNINMPDIHQTLVIYWRNACIEASHNRMHVAETHIASAEKWVDDLNKSIAAIKKMHVGGVLIMRP